ncbi:GAF domain-containing protein [Agrococcus sp. Ld7]|uniref:GAF domain-containing protein n=1 Tax=Agrococcus sp. Ld7 TaxID=649148 RepID=UPI00386564D8
MHALRSADSPQQAYEACLDAVLIAAAASIGEIVIADTSRHHFFPLVSRGLDDTYRRATSGWQLHEGLAGRAYSLREPVVARDLQQHAGAARVPTWRQELRGYMCVPMLLGSRRVGAIEVFSMAPREFVADEIDAVEELATLIATVVDARRTAEQLELLRAQRGSFARRWTAQWSIATQVERERIAKSLDVAIETIERGDLAAAQVAALVRDVASGVRAAERAVVDGEALLRSQIRSSMTDAQWRTMRIEFDAWPELLPLEFATRHALAIGQLIGRARERIGMPITVHARSEGSELLVELVTPSNCETTLEEIIDAEVTARALLDELGAGYALLLRDATRIIRIGVVPPSATPVMKELSPRERNVLAELGTASSNAQLAADLGISVKTLQNHVTAIYRKLGVAGRVEALAMLHEPAVE